MKNKNRIKDNGDPCGIPVLVSIQLLSKPGYAIRVRLPCVKQAIAQIIHSGILFERSIPSSLSWGTLSKAPARSRLSIETTLPGFARHAVCIHEVSRPIADIAERSFRALIWVYVSSACSSAARLRRMASTFSTTFASVFSSAIGR